jgi:hypothetical protein
MAALKSGDRVRVKKGTGEIMTIERIERVDSLDIAFCHFESKTQDHHETIVLLKTLERVLDVA